MKSGIIVFVVVVVVLIGAYFFLNSDAEDAPEMEASSESSMTEDVSTSNEQSMEDTSDVKEEDTANRVVIRRTSDGYEPSEVVITIGETVSFVNDTDRAHWPASDVHPTHQIYSAFDPRRPVGPGETWSFTFERAGEWQFHDHLRASMKGIVTVQAPVEQ